MHNSQDNGEPNIKRKHSQKGFKSLQNTEDSQALSYEKGGKNMCNHLISCSCYAGVNLPLKKSLFQVFFDVLGFEAVYEGVDSSGKETVYHYDDNANRNTESESQIIGQVHKAPWHVIQARDEELRRAGGQSLHAALRAGHSQNSGDDD